MKELLTQLRRGSRRHREDPVDRALKPVSAVFGFDRGLPIDRYYIESFLAENRALIYGDVLEIGDDAYTRKFGASRTTSHVLHFTPGSPGATLVGDLASGENIPRNSFDCAILTQTLPFIYNVSGAVDTIHSMLRPGGVALLTVPGISQISRYDMERWGDFWRFTDMSVWSLLTSTFEPTEVMVKSYGNVFVASQFLYGRAAQELTLSELNALDEDYQVIIAARAVKSLR